MFTSYWIFILFFVCKTNPNQTCTYQDQVPSWDQMKDRIEAILDSEPDTKLLGISAEQVWYSDREQNEEQSGEQNEEQSGEQND